MILTATAERMMDTLPSYYWGNEIIQRIVQARANEIDRMDALIDELKRGLIPAGSDDTLGLLTIWERILGIPTVGVSVAERQVAMRAALKRLNAVAAADVLDLLALQLGGAFSIARDTPGPLQDTISIGFGSSSFAAVNALRIIQRVWPAHRELLVHYSGGFLLDDSPLDTGTF